jgi:hypothetical protein
MRILLVIGFAALALWRSWIDWQDTLGQGYAFRMASVERVLSEAAPRTYANGVAMIQGLGVPWLWDPIGKFCVGAPLALVPAVIALLLWITRRRARGRG